MYMPLAPCTCSLWFTHHNRQNYCDGLHRDMHSGLIHQVGHFGTMLTMSPTTSNYRDTNFILNICCNL